MYHVSTKNTHFCTAYKTFLAENVFRSLFARVEYLQQLRNYRMASISQLDHLYSLDRCTIQVGSETAYGACDQIECGCRSAVICASEDCVNCPCEGHANRCLACQKYFCESSDKRLES